MDALRTATADYQTELEVATGESLSEPSPEGEVTGDASPDVSTDGDGPGITAGSSDTPTDAEGDPTSPSAEISDADFEAAAATLGTTGPELRGLYDAFARSTNRINASGSVNGAALLNHLRVIIDGGRDPSGQPLQGSASTIARARSIAFFITNARRLEAGQPQLASQLGIPRLNQMVAQGINRIPNEGVRNIINNYIGPNSRSDAANADQRINDLTNLLNWAAGNEEFNLETHGRAMFELVLDNGSNAVTAIRDLLPEGSNARQRFDQTMERINSKMDQMIQRLGSEAPSVLRGVINSSPESARYLFRFLTDDGVGKTAHAIDFIGNLANSEAGRALLGERGQRNLTAITQFLELDNFSQAQLRTLLNGSAEPSARIAALRNLASNFMSKATGLSAIQLQSMESLTGQALNRVAGMMGLDSVPPVRVGEAPTAVDGERAPLDGDRAPVETPDGPRGVDDTPDRVSSGDTPDIRPAGETVVDDVVSDATRLAEQHTDDLIRQYNLSEDAQRGLRRMLSESPEHAENVARVLREMGTESASSLDNILKIAAEMEPARALNMVVGEGMGARFMRGVADMVPLMQKYGMRVADIVPRLGTALGKAIPAAGALVSAYDTVRMADIALTGSHGGRQYNDPDVRALALLGSATNGLDTALGIAEAFGVGNVAFPVQLGLAGASMAIDLMVEYFNDNPEAMPEGMRKAIRYGAAATAVAAPFAMPPAGVAATVAIANIYGADGVVDIMNDMTRDLGEGALQGADYLTRLHSQALDQDLANIAGGMRGMADVIRNPERYAAMLGKEVSEVLSEATDWMAARAGEGVEAAREVYNTLADIAANPGQYAEAVRDRALQLGQQIGESVGHAAEAAGEFIANAAQQGWMSIQAGYDALLNMGERGVTAAREFGSRMLQAGGEAARQFMAFASDVAQNPGQYAQLVADGIGNAIANGWQATTEAADHLMTLAGQGVEAAGEALSNLVAAGGRAAERALTALANAPAQAREAIGRGLQSAMQAGRATMEMMQYVVNNPGEVAAAVGDAAVQVMTDTRDWLVARARDVGEGATQAVEALERFYTNTSQYLGDLGDRVGAALGRFEDTLVDLAGQGVNLGREIVDRYSTVLSQRLPELLAAWQDLQQAPIDLMVRIGKGTAEAGAQVAEYLASQATTLGREALEGLRELGSQGMQQLSQLAEQGGQMARQAIDQLSRMGESGYREISRLAQAGGAAATEAFNAIANAAERGVATARASLSQLAREAGELGQRAVQQLSELGDWGANQLRGLVESGTAQAQNAIAALGRMGNRGLEALEGLARAGGRYAQQAFDRLSSAGQAAIEQLRDLATSGSRFAQQAFDGLVSQGSRAISALREVGMQVEAFAGPAISALGRMGASAENAIRDIGTRFRNSADEAITALRGLGSQAIDSIQSLANRYTHLRADALRALSSMGASARQAMNSMIDDMWRSGQAGVSALMGMAGDIASVSSRVYELVTSRLSDGWERSSINPFSSQGFDVSPLTDAIGGLLEQARAAGGEAYRQAREMAFRALRDLGVPEVAISAVRRVI